MKKCTHLLLIVTTLALIGCFDDVGIINVLTDDLLLYDVVEKFNAINNNTKVNIIYNNDKQKNIFEIKNKKDIEGTDLIIGNLTQETNVDYQYFKKIQINLDSTNDYIKDHYEKNFMYSLPYSVDFFVVVTKKGSKINNTNNFVTFDDIKNFLADNKTDNKILFSPKISYLSQLDSLFFMNATLEHDDKYYYFNTSNTNKAYNTYINFDKIYNKSPEECDNILKKYVNINREFYLKKDIILFDIMPLSQALTLDHEKYSIFFIKDSQYTTLDKKVIMMTNNIIMKDVAMDFISFVISQNIQQLLLTTTISNSFYYDKINIPINQDFFDVSSDFIPAQYIKNTKDVITKIQDINFFSSDIKTNFFNAYIYTNDMLEKNMISQNDFLFFMTKEIN